MDDPDALARGMLRVIEDPALSSRLSMDGRQRVKTFDKDRIIRQYYDVMAAL